MSNVSKQSFAMDPAVGVYAFLGGRSTVQGWLDPGAVASTYLLADAQRSAGVYGPAVEIGVHHGLYFILLALFGKSSLAIDVFEDQHLNIDGSGHGDREIFEENLRRHLPPSRAAEVSIQKRDSLTISPNEILSWLNQASPILFSVDGGHTAPHAEHDTRLAAETCSEGGIIIVDDFENPSWPGVREGIENFFKHDFGDWRPLAVGNNKLYLAHRSHLDQYTTALLDAARHADAERGTATMANFEFPRIHFTEPVDALNSEQRRDFHMRPSSNVVRFAPGEPCAVRLLSGWSSIEPTGVWNDGEQASIELFVGESRGPIRVNFRVHCYVPERAKGRRAIVRCEGQILENWHFEDSGSWDRSVVISPAVPTRSGWLTVEIEMNRAPSPSELKTSEDTRHLGIALESLGIVDA